MKVFISDLWRALYKKIKFSINNFSGKCDQIQKLRIWSHLLKIKKSLTENLIFCAD